jgi:hypothetical protein
VVVAGAAADSAAEVEVSRVVAAGFRGEVMAEAAVSRAGVMAAAGFREEVMEAGVTHAAG